MSVTFSALTEKDLPLVCDIYNYYIANSTVVYFTEPITTEEAKNFIPLSDRTYPSFLIYNEAKEAVGFCYFSRFKARQAFDISVEVTMYFKPDCQGRGYGSAAMELLDREIRSRGFQNAVLLIDSENKASIRLAEKCGFAECGAIRHVAEKFGKKLTLVIMQKLL